MSISESVPLAVETLADVMSRVGDVALNRIRIRPALGTATIQDVIDLERTEKRLCELVAGILVEKAVGYTESLLAVYIGEMLNAFVRPRNLGHVTGSDGTMEIMPDLVRIPDVAVTSWNRLPGGKRPDKPVPRLVPNLAVEILSEGNTPAEMSVKRHDYFEADVELVWEIDPEQRSATVYRSLTDFDALTEHDRLEGGTVLPGFELKLADVFAELDRYA